jgi:hypothetical protein
MQKLVRQSARRMKDEGWRQGLTSMVALPLTNKLAHPAPVPATSVIGALASISRYSGSIAGTALAALTIEAGDSTGAPGACWGENMSYVQSSELAGETHSVYQNVLYVT